MRVSLAASLSLLALGALVAAGASAIGGPPPAEEVARWRSPAGDLVAAYRGDAVTEAEARDVLEAVPARAGRVTLAVIYGDGAPPPLSLAAAPDLAAALRLVASPPHDRWTHRLRVNPAGLRTYD